MRKRLLAALALASLAAIPLSVQPVAAIYCYPGDPPAVYQACLAYNGGIGQQVNNQNQLQNIQSNLTRLVASTSVRDQLLNQRLRYIDSYGALNYAQLVLTSSNFNQMMDRMIAAQQ